MTLLVLNNWTQIKSPQISCDIYHVTYAVENRKLPQFGTIFGKGPLLLFDHYPAKFSKLTLTLSKLN